MRIRRPIGIDLGTTNSCVGVMNATQTEVILFKTAAGASTTPSCVWYDERNNEVVVGRDAYVRRGELPAPVVSVKRSMGKLVQIPLGKASRLPDNLPAAVKRALSESRQERLQRYLARLEAANPQELEAIREKKRAAPPLWWVMDQATRLERYLESLDDAQVKAEAEKDPPLLWLPEEISALILAEERRQIQQRQRELEPDTIHVADRCLITVPAYFGAEQMEATKEAGALAGMEVLELLQEPSAAAVYYCWKSNIQNGLFLVFDLGGGTFDVSILRKQVGWSQVLGTSGDNLLGGDDFDRTLAESIRATVAKETPRYDLELQMQRPEDRSIWEALVFMAEGVKKALSREPSYLLRDTSLRDRKGERLNIDMKITQTQFDELIAPLIEKCIPKCWEAIAKAKLKSDVSLSDIDQIFLVGGATHVPAVQRAVRERFCGGGDAVSYKPWEIEAIVEAIYGDDPEQTQTLRKLARDMMNARERARCEAPMIDNPDLCVALGAAVQAAGHGVEEQSEHASIIVTSARSTSEATTPVAGKVIGGEDLNLEGAAAQLVSEALGVDLETDLEADGSFVFRSVPLADGAENAFELSVLDADGEELARSSVVIAQLAAGLVRAFGGGSAATVSRPYTLDVVRHGVITRKILVASGAALPVERQPHELAVPDPNTGVIYFKVFQGARLLKRIEAFLDPAIRPGTPITFTFSISRDHFMRATYQIAGDPEEHPVVIEPPDSLKPGKAEMAKVKDAIDQELETLDPVKRESFQIRLERLGDSAREAEERGDEPKLIDRYEQLQGLHEEVLRENMQLKPLLKEFEKSYQDCVELLGAIKGEQPHYADEEIRKNLRAMLEAGRTAYEKKIQDQYSAQVESVRKTWEFLNRDYYRNTVASEPPIKRAAALIEEGLNEAKNLLQMADGVILQIGDRADTESDTQVKTALINHLQQCRQGRENLLRCRSGFQELKATYTNDPEKAIEECYAFFPTLTNARNVLEQKQAILDGKTTPETEPIPFG